MNPRVFFVQKSFRRVGFDWELTVDPTPAKAYGEIRYLLDHADVDDLSLREVFSKLVEGLKDFSREDFLVLVGNATAIMMAGIIASDLTEGCIKILHWERTTTKYVEFTLDLDVLFPHISS